ncbi:MAG: hypothetical protein ACI87O_000641 [Planctomycetota bacterium]|jgi:hypothetical protein
MSPSPTPSSAESIRRAGPPAAVAAILPDLLAGREPEGISVLKPGAVFQLHTGEGSKDLIVKLYKRSPKLRAKLQPPGAKRAVDAYLRLLPVPSPAPVYWDKLDHPAYRSVLVYEYAEGPTLHQLWKQDNPQAIEALPALLAATYKTGLLHGDLHGRNLVWAEDRWMVLDLDSIRSGLHAVRRRAIWERTWARLLFDFAGSPRGKELFARFLDLAGLTWSIEESWKRVLSIYEEICAVHLAADLHPGD